jgi:hypothetical protein
MTRLDKGSKKCQGVEAVLSREDDISPSAPQEARKELTV